MADAVDRVPGAGAPHGKADPRAYQADWLREVGEAVAAGFPPQEEDPADREYVTDPAEVAALWAQVGQ